MLERRASGTLRAVAIAACGAGTWLVGGERVADAAGMGMGMGMAAEAGPGSATTSLEDPNGFPAVPRPGTLPELTHADAELTLELQGTRFEPSGILARSHPAVEIAEIATDFPLIDRRLFAFGRYDMALGNPGSTNATSLLGGNLAAGARGLWATTTGLGFGGGVGVDLPTSIHTRSDESRAFERATDGARPWNVGSFEEGSLGLRPFVDVRQILGRFILQARQTFLYSIDLRGARDASLRAAGTVAFVVRTERRLSFSLELHELYEVSGVLSDDRRAAFAGSVGGRLAFERLEPWFGLTTTLGPTPVDAIDRGTSARVGLTVLLDRSAMRFRR